MSSRKRPPSPTAKFYRVDDLAGFFDVSKRTIWSWVAAGHLPEPLRKPHWSGWPKAQIDKLLSKGGDVPPKPAA